MGLYNSLRFTVRQSFVEHFFLFEINGTKPYFKLLGNFGLLHKEEEIGNRIGRKLV